VQFGDDEDPTLSSAAKNLFKGYFDELRNEHGCDLTFQSFQDELASLPGKFAFSSKGGLWVASVSRGVEGDGNGDIDSGDDDEDDIVVVAPGSMIPGGRQLKDRNIVGVVALKELTPGVGEVKRMFVGKKGRRKGVGGRLLRVLLDYAKSKHYMEIKLDSLERLRSALSLYEKSGFVRCEKYVECPEEDHVCLALQLASEATG